MILNITTIYLKDCLLLANVVFNNTPGVRTTPLVPPEQAPRVTPPPTRLVQTLKDWLPPPVLRPFSSDGPASVRRKGVIVTRALASGHGD